VKNATWRSTSSREPVTRRVAHPAKIPAVCRRIQPIIHSDSENSISRAIRNPFLVRVREGRGTPKGGRLARLGVSGVLLHETSFQANAGKESLARRARQRTAGKVALVGNERSWQQANLLVRTEPPASVLEGCQAISFFATLSYTSVRRKSRLW